MTIRASLFFALSTLLLPHLALACGLESLGSVIWFMGTGVLALSALHIFSFKYFFSDERAIRLAIAHSVFSALSHLLFALSVYWSYVLVSDFCLTPPRESFVEGFMVVMGVLSFSLFLVGFIFTFLLARKSYALKKRLAFARMFHKTFIVIYLSIVLIGISINFFILPNITSSIMVDRSGNVIPFLESSTRSSVAQ